jgi:hypothetical protein
VIKDRLSISWLKNSLEKVMPPWSSSQFYHLVWHGILDLLLYFHWKNVIIYESSYGNSVFFYARCFIECSPWSKLERWPFLKAWEELLDLMLIPSSSHHILLFFNLEYDLWLCDLETLYSSLSHFLIMLNLIQHIINGTCITFRIFISFPLTNIINNKYK